MGTAMKTFERYARRVLLTGCIAGSLDIGAAFLQYFLVRGKNPIIVLNFIASGVFGNDAFGENIMMPLAGLFFHYFIATVWTFLYFTAVNRLPVPPKWWGLNGFVYGIVVWCGMNLIVVPLSNTPPLPFRIEKALIAAAVLIACIGLPIAYSAMKYFSFEGSEK